MRQHRRVIATFEDGDLTATYTGTSLDAGGGIVASRQRTGEFFSMAGMAALNISVPAELASDVVRLQYQVAASSAGPWGDARDDAGELIQTPKASSDKTLQDCKGDVLLVDVNMFAAAFVKLVPVDASGQPDTPGGVVFELSLKE